MTNIETALGNLGDALHGPGHSVRELSLEQREEIIKLLPGTATPEGLADITKRINARTELSAAAKKELVALLPRAQDPVIREQIIGLLQQRMVVLPNGTEVRLFLVPGQPITEQAIREAATAMFHDPGLVGYERVFLRNILLGTRERLRQQRQKTAASPESQLDNAYLQTYDEYIGQDVVRYYQEMQRYARLRRQYPTATVPPGVEAESVAHMNALSSALHVRTRVGNFASLIFMKGEKEGAAEAAQKAGNAALVQDLRKQIQELTGQIGRARTGLQTYLGAPRTPPNVILCRAPEAFAAALPAWKTGNETRIPIGEFINADTQENQMGNLQKAGALLDAEISWIMSYRPGTPGYPQQAQGVLENAQKFVKERYQSMTGQIDLPTQEYLAQNMPSPPERLTGEVLEAALRQNVEQERKLPPPRPRPSGANPTNEELRKADPELWRIRDARNRIVAQMLEQNRTGGIGTIRSIRNLTVHHAFGEIIEGPAASIADPTSRDEVVRAYIEKSIKEEVAKFTTYFDLALGPNGPLRMDVPGSIEEMFTTTGRQRMHRILETTIAIRSSPRDLVRALPAVALLRRLPVVGEYLSPASADEHRDKLMHDVRESMGFPRNFDILRANIADLPEANRKIIEERRKGIISTINTHRPKMEAGRDRFMANTSVLATLRGNPATNPNNLVNATPNTAGLATHLRNVPNPLGGPQLRRLTADSLAAIAQRPAGERPGLYAAAYLQLFMQMEEDWNIYMEAAAGYMNGLEGVLTTHVEIQTKVEEVTKKLMSPNPHGNPNTPWLQQMLIAGGTLVGSGGVAYAAGRFGRWGGWSGVGETRGAGGLVTRPWNLNWLRVPGYAGGGSGGGLTYRAMSAVLPAFQPIAQINGLSRLIVDPIEEVGARRGWWSHPEGGTGNLGAPNAANLPAVAAARPQLNLYRNLAQQLESLRSDLRSIPATEIAARQGILQEIADIERSLVEARQAVSAALAPGAASNLAQTQMLRELLGRTRPFTDGEMRTLAAMRTAYRESAAAFDAACFAGGISVDPATLLRASVDDIRIALSTGRRVLSGTDLDTALNTIVQARDQIAASQLQAMRQGQWAVSGNALTMEAQLLIESGATGRPVIAVRTPVPAPAPNVIPVPRLVPPIAEPIPDAWLAPSIAEPVIPDATRAPSAMTVAEANRLRGIARFGRLLDDTAKAALASLTEASSAVQRYEAGLSVLGSMGERGQNTIAALRTLTPAEVEIVSNAVLNAHQLGRDISFFEAKIEMLVALQEHPTIGPKLLGKWQTFREAFIRSGICGSSVEVLASPAALARLSAPLRAALLAHVTTPQGLHILELCETPAFLDTLNALPEAQLPRALRVLGSAPMAAIDIALIDPTQLAKMVRLFGSGTPAELRGFFGILRQSGALPEAAALMSQEARVVMLLVLQEAEFSRILTLCGESLEARAAVFAITDAARLRALATHLAEPSVVALLRTRGANIGEAITILSDATRAADAAALVREAQAAGTVAGRSRVLATLARGGGFLRNIGSTGLGILHRANPVLMPLAVAGEAYTMYDNEQANQSMEVAHKTLEQSLRGLLGSSFTADRTPEGHTVFVHTSGVTFDMTKMISDVEALRGSDFIRRTTDIAAIIGAYAMLFGAPGMVAGGVLMAGSFISRELQAPQKARLWRSFIGDLPKELLSIVPSNIFGGDRLDNFQLYVFLRSHPGNGNAPVNPPQLTNTSDDVFAHRQEELARDDGLQRVVLRSFVQECERQQIPAVALAERPGETVAESVTRDIAFLHRCFADLFTDETSERYQEAVAQAIALWTRQKLAQFVERGRARLAVSQDGIRENLMRDLAPILEHAPAIGPADVRGNIASLQATLVPGSPEEGGFRVLQGDTLLPLELLEPAQAMMVLRTMGGLSPADRGSVLHTLHALPDIAVRAQFMERLSSQPRQIQDLMLQACRRAEEAGVMGDEQRTALRAMVEAAGNTMPGGASFTVGEYLDRSARGQTTPGYAPRPSTGGLSSGAVAASRRFEMYLPVNEQFQDIDRLVRGILEQMGARLGNTILGPGNARIESTTGLACMIATEGTGANAQTLFFHYNPEIRRWFWATNIRPDFIPINQTLDLRLPREARDPRRYILDQRLESYRPPAILDRASVMERMAQYAPHPQAALVWELASQLIQRNNGSDGAQIIPGTFPGGIEGFRYVYQGKEIQLASIGGWIRWKSPSQQSWSFVGSDLYPNPQSNSSEQWFNTLSRQLSGLQESMRTTDRAKKGLDAGSAFLRNAFNIQALVQIDGHPGFRITEQGRTLEAVCMSGLWFFHLNTGSPWADPALQSPAETYKVLRPVTSALARMNASAEPIEVYAAMSTAKMGGESILQALSQRGQKAVAAYDADALGRIERSNRAEMQLLVPFPRDLVTLGIRMRGDSMTLVERQEQGLAVTRIGSSRSSTFVELRCIAGQWQTRLGSTADAEADRKAQETTGEWVAIATGGQTLQQRVKTLRSTLRAPVMELGLMAQVGSPDEQYNGNSRIPFDDLRSYDERSRTAREVRYKEAQAEYQRSLAEAQFLDNCIAVVGRVTAVSMAG